MSVLNRFDNLVTSKNWDHQTFLRNLLLILVLSNLLSYVWIVALNLNGVIPADLFVILIRELVMGQLIGVISGLVLNFIGLLPLYKRKEWDLHIVVPKGLFNHVILVTVLLIFLLLANVGNNVFETAIAVGFTLGGLIPVLAYSGEVKKEHQDPVLLE